MKNSKRIDWGEFEELLEPYYEEKDLNKIYEFIIDISDRTVITDGYYFVLGELKRFEFHLYKTFKEEKDKEWLEKIRVCIFYIKEYCKEYIKDDYYRSLYDHLEFINTEFGNDYPSIIVHYYEHLRMFDLEGFRGDSEYVYVKKYQRKYRTFIKRQIKVYKNIQKFNPTKRKEFESKIKNGFLHKEQLIFLNEVGFFDLPKIKNLSPPLMGKVLGRLLGRDAKNSEMFFGAMNPSKPMNSDNNPYKIPRYLENIQSLFTEIGI